MEVYSEQQIKDRLSTLDGWVFDQDAIKKEWEFKDFAQAMVFINKIAEIAERHDHHPELSNVYSRVTLRFNTHVAGGITGKDFAIAAEIDTL